MSPTGTQFSLTHTVDYNRNNVGFNRFRSAYDGLLTGEFRHPLSFSPDFFRIAGANRVPGQYNGILLARINSDIQLADFEAAVRELVRDVERMYWELYYSYRDLDAKIGIRISLAPIPWCRSDTRESGWLGFRV